MKLHLGCGNKKLDGFINIDIQKTPAVDVLLDISQPLPYREVDLIYCCHTFEHFGRKQWKEITKDWFSCLKNGGILRIAVPDFEQVCEEYLRTRNINLYLGLVIGGQRDVFDYHKCIFDFYSLKQGLLEIGFKEVYRYDWRKTEHSTVDDYSRSYLPHMDFEHGKLMSLNVEAVK